MFINCVSDIAADLKHNDKYLASSPWTSTSSSLCFTSSNLDERGKEKVVELIF